MSLAPGESASRCRVIAEAGLNHNGSIEIAKQLIEVAAAAGADVVKFQKRTVSRLAVKATLDAADQRFPQFGSTYREIREHLEFDFNQYRDLKSCTDEHGLQFMVTAFDVEAVDFLERLGVESYKLASHSLTNTELLEYVARLGKPVVCSTGMADLSEIDTAVNVFKAAGTPLTLMHCVSAYPTPIGECNLQMMSVLRSRYDVPVGYSGHELGYLPTVAAAAMGAAIVERHFTLDKAMTGFDHKMSLSPEELTAMVHDIRQVEQAIGTGEKSISETEWITRRKYHVSMASATEIRAGQVLSASMVTWRNPGTGIPPKLAHTVLGKRASHDIPSDALLTPDMFN
jgi:sialic acid synthase SpsE